MIYYLGFGAAAILILMAIIGVAINNFRVRRETKIHHRVVFEPILMAKDLANIDEAREKLGASLEGFWSDEVGMWAPGGSSLAYFADGRGCCAWSNYWYEEFEWRMVRPFCVEIKVKPIIEDGEIVQWPGDYEDEEWREYPYEIVEEHDPINGESLYVAKGTPIGLTSHFVRRMRPDDKYEDLVIPPPPRMANS